MAFKPVLEELKLLPPLKYRLAFKSFTVGLLIGLALHSMFVYQGIKFIKQKYFDAK